VCSAANRIPRPRMFQWNRPMERPLFRPAAALPAVFLMALAACEAQKSSNPLSPSVAGPIAGVEISAPRMLEPAQGQKYKESQQPIRLLVENATTTGVRPLYYTFEVASDSAFETKMYARSQVIPGQDGKTSVQIDKLELGRGYYWRARAEDGANSGPFASVQFEVLPRASLGPPVAIAPVNNVVTSSRQPTLMAGPPDRNSAVGALTYEFHVATDQAFGQMVATNLTGETGGQTRFTPESPLPANLQLFWRVRASDSETQGPWSGVQAFITPPTAGPPPPGPPPPAPGAPCISSSPEAIVQCERAKFGHMSSSQTVSFLRAVAHSLNASGIAGGPFGILVKSGGSNCDGYSCDIICAGQGGSQRQWDVLIDSDGAQIPVWEGPLSSIAVRPCEIQ
jgi:hypothetical protein